jgi:hypothetical protein
MKTKKGNPAARGDAGRASKVFSLATEHLEDTRPPLPFQLAYLGRRFGLTPSLAAIVAPLAFGEARP